MTGTLLGDDLVFDDDDDLVAADGVGVEVLINGRQVGQPVAQPCEHKALSTQTIIGFLHDDNNGGVIVGRQVLLKVRCAECGVPMTFDYDSARRSETVGERGVVVDVVPVDDS